MFPKLVKIIVSVFVIFSGLISAPAFSRTHLYKKAFLPFAKQDTSKNTAPADTLKKAKGDNGKLKSKIKYTARDSIRFDISAKKVYLFGNAEVNYEDINLKAASIVIDWNDQSVNASEGKDSLGKIIGKPEFTQGAQKFNASSMKYNFETKKGKINYITTTEGDGFIRGETIKKDENNNFFIKNGYYTTCNADTPHYYIGAQKLEVIKDDKIVTGPAVMVIEGITTPLVLPFGFFPHKSGRSSGILIPAYGESTTLGFNLRNGGYYFGISDNVDLALRGDIYTRGNWAVNGTTNYIKRYKYNGNLKLSYSNTNSGDPDMPTSLPNSEAYFINWSHTQDPKSSPVNRFSASVNAGSSTYYQQYVSYSPTNYLTNTFTSNISYSRIFPNKPYNLSVNARHSQNTLNKSISLGLPDVVFSVNRLNPFKSKLRVGPERWYEKIGVNYSAMASNQIETYDSLLFREQTLKDMRNGLKQNSSVSTNFKVLKYFSLSPSVNYNEYWYLQTIKKNYNQDSGRAIIDTVQGFKSARDFNFSTSLSTIIYGMVQFKNPVVKAIRHVITPSFGYSWRPDFSEPGFGFYDNVQSDSTGKTVKYSFFEQGLYGSPGGGKSSVLNFSIDNNLEVKVRNRNDTASGTKKIKIFESLNFSSQYNLAADSMKLGRISINGRTTLIKDLAVNFSGSVNPYVTDAYGRSRDEYYWNDSKRLGELTNANFSTGYTFNSAETTPAPKPAAAANINQQELANIKAHPEEYMNFNIPWSFRVNYNINYVKIYEILNSTSTVKQPEFTQSLSFSGDISLTPRWKISYTSGYDFINKDFTYTNLTIYRDLHCWEMKVFWIPFGVHQSYNFQINVKSAILQDLKLIRRRDWNQY